MPKVTDPALLAQLGNPSNTESGNVIGLEDLGGGYKRNQFGQVFREGPRGGISKVSGPNDTMVTEAATQAKGLSGALASIDRLDKQLRNVKTLGPTGIIMNPKEFAVAQQTAKDLMLRMKESPYNLGVLNGPDLQIMNDIIADPGALKSMAFRQTVTPMLRNLASIVGENYRANEDQFKAVGGMPRVMVPLYQAPDSRYSKDQWGKSGRIPQQQVPQRKASGALTPAEQAEYDALKKRFNK